MILPYAHPRRDRSQNRADKPFPLAQNFCRTFFVVVIAALTASCAGVSLGGGSSTSPVETIAISPNGGAVISGETQQFTATVSNASNPAVIWYASLGTISSTGLFTAPLVTTVKTVTVTVTSLADTSKDATATIEITPKPPSAVTISISPGNTALSSGFTQQFTATVSQTANTSVRWISSIGTISSTGLFTAPYTTSTLQGTVTATSLADTSKSETATITVTPTISIAISPISATLTSGETQQFRATVSNANNTAVTWTSSIGSVSSSGVFTAPSVTSATEATVTATSVADSTQSATAEVAINPSNAPQITISISPTGATLTSGTTQQFTATVTNSSNTAVTWSASIGAVSSAGIFTAPTVNTVTQMTVTATSVADTSKRASAAVTVDPASTVSAPIIQTPLVPGAVEGVLYRTTLLADAGTPPYHWSVASGNLPAGILLNRLTGELAGTPSAIGTSSFMAEVTDSNSQTGEQSFSLEVVAPNQPNTIPTTYFGMHLANVADFPTGYVGALGKASAVYWPFIERQRGTYDWSRLDAWSQAAQAKNVPFYFSNDYVPRWAAADTSTCSSTIMGVTICTSGVANIQDWDDFITALVTRYRGKIQIYELWNEPDNYFTGTIADMVTLTNHMANIVRARDPEALIVAPSAGDASWLDSYWAAGGVKNFDIAATHDYPDPTNPVAESICAFRSLPLKSLLVKYGIQTPIWDTEGSWGGLSSLSDPDLEAAYVARNALLHWACGVPRYYWYAWDGQYPYWGMLWSSQNGLDEAGVAYESVYVWMDGASMPNSCLMNGGPIPEPPALFHGVYTCDLTRPGGYQAQAVWNTDGSSSFTAPAQFTQYRDLTGQTYPIPSNHEVTIGNKPILLEN